MADTYLSAPRSACPLWIDCCPSRTADIGQCGHVKGETSNEHCDTVCPWCSGLMSPDTSIGG